MITPRVVGLVSVVLAAGAWARPSLLATEEGSSHGLHLVADAGGAAPVTALRTRLAAELEELRDLPSVVPGVVMTSVGWGLGAVGAVTIAVLLAQGGWGALALSVLVFAFGVGAVVVGIVGTVLLIRAAVIRGSREDRIRELEAVLARPDMQLPARPEPRPAEVAPPGVWLAVPPPALLVASF